MHNVPFLVRRPGVAPGRSDDLVSLIDIFPTVVDLAGYDPGAVDGLSLLAHGRRFAELYEPATDPGELTPVTGQSAHAEAERDLRAGITTSLLPAAPP